MAMLVITRGCTVSSVKRSNHPILGFLPSFCSVLNPSKQLPMFFSTLEIVEEKHHRTPILEIHVHLFFGTPVQAQDHSAKFVVAGQHHI